MMAYPAQPCPRTPTCPPTWTSHSGPSPQPALSKVCPVLEGNSAIPLVAPLSVTLHVSSLVLQLALPLKLFSPPPRLPCQSWHQHHQHLSLVPPAVFLLLLLPPGGIPATAHFSLLFKTLVAATSLRARALGHLPSLPLEPHLLPSSSSGLTPPAGFLTIPGRPQYVSTPRPLHLPIPWI